MSKAQPSSDGESESSLSRGQNGHSRMGAGVEHGARSGNGAAGGECAEGGGAASAGKLDAAAGHGSLTLESQQPSLSENRGDKDVNSRGQPVKRKKKDKTAALLSFSDELEDGNDGSSEFGSISQSTTKRFLAEERKRRRQEEEERASSAFSSSTPSAASPPTPSHQLSAQSAPSDRTPAQPRRQQCVVDDDQTAWLPLGVRHQVSERQGKRPYMEDKALFESDWHHKGWHLFGVFDGHGGSRASSYVCAEIPAILRSRIVESERDVPAGVKEITEAFESSFSEVDRRFLDIARAEQLKDGTTVLLGLLRHNTLHMGWVGDSRCILSRQVVQAKGRYVRVSEDHKPDRPDERRAVEARGGQVIFRGTYRVAGPTALAVSRAIGDILMKEPRKLVISDPEIKTIDLLPQDEFLVMASDGLFDVMEDQSIIDAVGNHLKEHKSYTGAADKLTALAIEKGSLDNVTVVIISFIWGADAVDAHVS